MAKPTTQTFDRPDRESTAATEPAPPPAEHAPVAAQAVHRCTGCGAPIPLALEATMTSCGQCWAKANVIGYRPQPGHAKVTVKG